MPTPKRITTAGHPPHAYRRDLTCRTVHPDLFYSDAPTEQAKARRICRRCPAQLACARWAVDHDLSWGIWGGYDPDQRRAIKAELDRRTGNTPPPAGPADHLTPPRPLATPWSWPGGGRRRTDFDRLFDVVSITQPGQRLIDVATRHRFRYAKVQEAALIHRWAPDLVPQVCGGWIRIEVAAGFAGQVRDAHAAAARAAA